MKNVFILGGLALTGFLIVRALKAQAAEPTQPLTLVSYNAPDSVVAGEMLHFSITVKSGYAQDVTFYGHFIKSVGTAYDRADHLDVHLEAGQEALISFSIQMLPTDHWAWEWERADPSKGLITVVAHDPETLAHIADWTLKEITVYRA